MTFWNPHFLERISMTWLDIRLILKLILFAFVKSKVKSLLWLKVIDVAHITASFFLQLKQFDLRFGYCVFMPSFITEAGKKKVCFFLTWLCDRRIQMRKKWLHDREHVHLHKNNTRTTKRHLKVVDTQTLRPK